jgi:chromosome segregation ATPase
MGLNKEKELREIVTDMEYKLEANRKQISDLKDDRSQLELKFVRLQEQSKALEKESDQKKADLFSLENEIKHLQRYLEINSDLRLAYDMSQKEIMLLGELLRRHQESQDPPIENQRYLREEMEDLRQTCEEEIRGLRSMLESKMSQCEVAAGMINDLEKKLEKREAIIMEQKQNLLDAVTEHQTQLAVHDRLLSLVIFAIYLLYGKFEKNRMFEYYIIGL